MTDAASSEPKAKIFVSYSRRDMTFVDRLEPALQALGFKLLIDRAEIYAFENWWQRIETLIAQADSVVFVLSPEAVSSDICRKEVAFAASLNKRFAPIVCRRVDDKLVPEALARLNFIFFDDEARFEDSVARLADALQTDIEWIRKHTDFGEAARRWATSGGSEARGLLLRSPVLEQAERWIASRPHGAPAPTDNTQAFIAESRRAATRRRNILTGSLAAGLVLALGLAALAYWQRGVAVTAQALAERNFDAAKSTVNRVLFDLADGLRDVEGIRAETVRVILGRAENAIGDLASRTANDPEVRRSQEVMYNQFSDIYLRLGATQLAVEHARKALAIGRAMLAETPGNTDWQHDVSVALERLGDALLAQGDRTAALTAYGEILDLRRALSARNPNDISLRRGVSVVLQKVGEARQEEGDRASALAAIARASTSRAPLSPRTRATWIGGATCRSR
jgi:tetratricopeptide (TPR) repeat protein